MLSAARPSSLRAFSRASRAPAARRGAVKMSAAEKTLDKSTPDSKWKELLTAQERYDCYGIEFVHSPHMLRAGPFLLERYHVLREKGTEPPNTGEYNKGDFAGGHFACRACGAKLYSADTKFSSGCGWPSFYDNLPDTVERHDDSSMGMTRTEITCKNCGGHLGHVFKGEGFGNPIDERHCVNSLSIKFVKA